MRDMRLDFGVGNILETRGRLSFSAIESTISLRPPMTPKKGGEGRAQKIQCQYLLYDSISKQLATIHIVDSLAADSAIAKLLLGIFYGDI